MPRCSTASGGLTLQSEVRRRQSGRWRLYGGSLRHTSAAGETDRALARAIFATVHGFRVAILRPEDE